MSKVRPTNPLDQLDLGFGSAEDLKPKKQTPLKTGPSPFDAKLENAVTEREAQRVLRSMQAEKAVSEADKARAAEKAAEARDLARRFVAEGKGVFGGGGGGGGGGGTKSMKYEPKSYKKGGKVKVPSASKRADGIAQRGKTRGRMV